MNKEVICLSFVLLIAIIIITYDISTRELEYDIEEYFEYELINNPF